MKKRVLSILVAVCVAVMALAGCGQASQSQQASDSATSAANSAAQAQGDVQYVLYLGTNDKDTNEPVFSHEECKEKARQILISKLGGYTIQEAEGGWVGDNGKVCQEYTLVIYLSDTTEDKVHEVSDELVKTFRQSSVLIQKNVTQTEFYSGAQE